MAMVLRGINNIFTVSQSGKQYECVIKGKKLKNTGRTYAPLAPGDEVEIEQSNDGFSLITARKERKTEFCRWNTKRKAPQTMAANVDAVVCVTSPESPPFRPRFIDRVQVTCEIEHIPLVVVLNKIDQGVKQEIEERLVVFESTGCGIIRCSALTGENVNALEEAVRGKRCLFCGQSGVGKTSLLNKVLPGPDRETGDISAKYNRGRHTTRFGTLFWNPAGGWIIDTPGIRAFEIVDIEAADLSFFFPEMAQFRDKCASRGCTHDHEPNCSVIEAAEEGHIHEDRYESYLRILDSLRNRGVMYG